MLINKIYLPNLFDYYKQWLMSLPFTDELSTDHCVGLETRNSIPKESNSQEEQFQWLISSSEQNYLKCTEFLTSNRDIHVNKFKRLFP